MGFDIDRAEELGRVTQNQSLRMRDHQRWHTDIACYADFRQITQKGFIVGSQDKKGDWHIFLLIPEFFGVKVVVHVADRDAGVTTLAANETTRNEQKQFLRELVNEMISAPETPENVRRILIESSPAFLEFLRQYQ